MKKLNGRLLVSGLAGLLLSIQVGASNAQEQGVPFKFGTALGYPPFEYMGPDGKMTGFEIELGNAICEQMKRPCEWQDVEFSSMTPALKARKFDAFIASVAVTEDRKKQVLFSDKIYSSSTRFLARKQSGLLPNAAALAGKRVGVEQGTINERFAKRRWATEGVKVVSYPDQDTMYSDLASGRLDGVIVAGIQAQLGFLTTEKGSDFELVGQTIVDPIIGNDYSAIAVNQGNQQVVDDLNRALAELRANGTYDRLASKYFPSAISLKDE